MKKLGLIIFSLLLSISTFANTKHLPITFIGETQEQVLQKAQASLKEIKKGTFLFAGRPIREFFNERKCSQLQEDIEFKTIVLKKFTVYKGAKNKSTLYKGRLSVIHKNCQVSLKK